MATYLEKEYTLLATNPTFVARVRMGYVHVAREVLTEDPATPGNALRVSFARMVVGQQDVEGSFFVALVAADQTVIDAAVAVYDPNDEAAAQAGVSDEVILQSIRDVWSILAGVTPA